ncbi:AMP-binding protein [uncultured Corynebacterium sp.]|uniref:AMP-binding protein n=1 Tax=uncultured Corynebacterium sp. TaxID=159447 RepID=UPI0025EB1456|nr:AMP-binding protein [uncultured Corynebacterium sp.]
MSNFTLTPRINHGAPATIKLQQFGYFLRILKDLEVLEPMGAGDIAAAAKSFYRWGALETTMLFMAARMNPDRLGLVDDDGELTYGEFWELTNRLARALQARGVKAGTNVAVLARNGRAAILPLTCRHMLGFNIFMVNANTSAKQLEHVLAFNHIDVFILDDEFLPMLADDATEKYDIILGHVDDPDNSEHYETMEGIIGQARVTDSLPTRPKRGFHVVMTSGTRGMPKGVIRGAFKSPQGAAPLVSGIPWKRGLTVILTSVLFHAYGWANLVLSLFTQVTIIARRGFSPEETLRDIQHYHATAMCSAASRLRSIVSYMDNEGIDHVDGLEFIVSAGSPLAAHEIEKTNEKFGGPDAQPVLCNLYGSSESGPIAVARPKELAADTALSGRIYPGEIVDIRDEDGNLVPEGEIGIIWVAVYDLFAGYTDQDIDIPTINGAICMHDRGYITDGNMLHVLGRGDDLIITQFAEKIFPIEIENVLVSHPRIHDSYVHGVADDQYGQAIRAYVIRGEGTDPITADEVREHVVNELSEGHRPRDVFFVDEFPRNPMGKVIRKKLPGHSTVE